MSLVTPSELYEHYKEGYHRANDALDALNRNMAGEESIKQAKRAKEFYESLANLWGRISYYNRTDDTGYTYEDEYEQ